MYDQHKAYLKLISVYPYEIRRFIRRIDAENESCMHNHYGGMRPGFMQDKARRDELVSAAASL